MTRKRPFALRARRTGARPRGRVTVAVLAMLLPLLVATPPVDAATGKPGPARPRPVPAEHPVPVHAVPPHRVSVPAVVPDRPRPVSWPGPGSADVNVPAATAGASRSTVEARAGSLPVWVGGASTGGLSTGGLRVTMASRDAARGLGIPGVVFTLASLPDRHAGAPVHVSLDYSGFAQASGGDFGGRLRLVRLPGCALRTPSVPACRVQTPVSTTNDVRSKRLGADLTVPAAGSAAVVLAADASAGGSGGDFTATPLSEAGSWTEGGPSGAFTYSYPLNLPPVPGGLTPKVEFAYSSQAVDGLTSSTNNQASWVGDGWDYAPGYVERSYQPCSQTSHKTGDLCWSANDITSLNLGGHVSTLVKDASTGAWHPESDQGERVQFLTGTGNGTSDGSYWVVTDTDGTRYYFGLTLPGYGSGDTPANAAWTAPVYASAAGQPCASANTYCDQAWRWNLDYVVDVHNDAVAYFYNRETNYYAENGGTTGSASYTRAGTLAKIEYGLRAGAIYGATPAAQVIFDQDTSRTDVPSDLSCASGATCHVQSPTFWSKAELTGVRAQSLVGSSLSTVDSWTLTHSYPATNDPSSPTSLWLASIARTGGDGTAIGLPPVKFTSRELANRVMTQSDLTGGYSIITRPRIVTVTNETGGIISVGYDTPGGACTSGAFPAPDANTKMCYPDYWTPSGMTSPILDWFNKYVVTGVNEQDTTGGGTVVATAYSYTGAAWHYNDNALTRSKNRTWDEWRGFRTVTTQVGTAPDPVTKETASYFQGMNGNYQSDGSTASVSLTSSRGDTVADAPPLRGTQFEEIEYNGTGGSQVSDTITIPWVSAATATQSQPSPLPALKSYLTDTGQSKEFTALGSGGYRQSQTTYTHDSTGRVTSVSDVPDTGDGSATTCTTTSYASNTGAWLLDLPAEVKVTAVPCGTTPSLPRDAVSDTLSFYDGATSLSADTPTAGEVTQAQQATSYSAGGVAAYTTMHTSTYDQYGRVLTDTDADNRTTTTGYAPATGAEPTTKTVKGPSGLTTVTAYDSARDLPTSVTDPAGLVTSEQYDSLGRLTAVWKPGHQQGSAAADVTFGYTVFADKPSVTTTDTVTASGRYLVSQALYDSMGRVAETQTATADGNRTVSDTYYDTAGRKLLESDPYYTTGAPSGTLVAATSNQVPSQTGYVYDGDGRVVRQISYHLAAETWETDTSYGGSYTTVSYKSLAVPQGGTPNTTFTDARDQTTAIYQYHAGVAPDPSGPATGYDKTTYTYTPAKKLATITDAAGNTWHNTYDLQGNRTSATDPDTGTTTSTYDAAGQMLTTTAASGKQVTYGYDLAGRKTAEYDTSGGAPSSPTNQIAAWTYDTVAKGQLTSATAYAGGDAYTTTVVGYNAYGLPTGRRTTIPASQHALAGTYEVDYAYDPYTLATSAYYDPAAGGLPAETVNLGYDAANQPASLTSTLWYYVSGLTYTELGQPLEYTMGTTNQPVNLTDGYDPQTNRLNQTDVVTGSAAPTTVDSTGYAYDNVGNVLHEADTPPGSPAQVQCFQYDYLGRLVQAWAQGSATCAGTPSQSAEGGAAPYWKSYRYDTVGNLLTQTSTPVSGAPTTVTDTYPAAGATQPHAVTTSTSAGPSGTQSTTYGYNPTGQTTSVSRPSGTQALTWNATGQLTADGATSYLYDADGNLLLQHDPTSVTLYLGDEQLVLNTDTGAVSGTRYYTLGGTTVAARTSTGEVDYLVDDRQGTGLLSINSATLAVSRRYYDPYGNPVGPAPAGWPGTKGFVGGTTDAATGLTNLGAREYDPAMDHFISPDPVLDATDPQSLNPYGYADANPSTNSDPTGTMCVPDLGTPDCYIHRAPRPSSGGGNSQHHQSGGGGGLGPCGIFGCSAIDVIIHGYRGVGGCTLYGCNRGTFSVPAPRPKPTVHGGTNGNQTPERTCRAMDFHTGYADGSCRPQSPSSLRTWNPMHLIRAIGSSHWGHWIWDNRANVWGWATTIECVGAGWTVVGGGICIGMQLAGLGIRTQYRVQHFGWHNSIQSTVVDSIITAASVGTGVALSRGLNAAKTAAQRNPGIFTKPGRLYKFSVGAVTSIPDYVQTIANWAPGADPNFFTNP